MDYVKSWRDKALDLYDEGKTVYQIRDELFDEIDSPNIDSKLKKVKRLIATYENTIDYPQELIEIDTNMKWNGTKHIKFALIGDTHIGSKWEQETALNKFYDKVVEEGVRYVYHCGDISDGYQMRKGQENEIYVHGFDNFVDTIVRKYPARESVKTYFIIGNHDESFSKSNGANIGVQIDMKRKDLIYLGADDVTINLTPNCTMQLYHGKDGSPQGYSLYAQKRIDSMDVKPNIIAYGHLHKSLFMNYRNVNTFMVGCFQGKTPFMGGKNLSASIGGWIVDVEVDNNGNFVAITPTWYGFEEIKNDYKM